MASLARMMLLDAKALSTSFSILMAEPQEALLKPTCCPAPRFSTFLVSFLIAGCQGLTESMEEKVVVSGTLMHAHASTDSYTSPRLTHAHECAHMHTVSMNCCLLVGDRFHRPFFLVPSSAHPNSDSGFGVLGHENPGACGGWWLVAGGLVAGGWWLCLIFISIDFGPGIVQVS